VNLALRMRKSVFFDSEQDLNFELENQERREQERELQSAISMGEAPHSVMWGLRRTRGPGCFSKV
jgi:hypothetical protein